jgi:TRAP-type C4-dicarboxylate transport system permease small subunit
MAKKKKVIEKEIVKPAMKPLHIEVVRQMLALATSGFGFVAALAWNNVIQEFVNTYVKKFLPQGSGFMSLLIYALIVTVFAVTVTFQISKLLAKVDPDIKDNPLKIK